MSENCVRLAGRLLLSILPLMIATVASAAVTLPTGDFTCGLFAPPSYNSVQLQPCSGSATLESASGNPDIQGVDLGTDSNGVTWNVDGSNTETLYDSLVMTSSGTVGGSGTFVGYMPLAYDFTITPLACSSGTCDVSWGLSLEITGSSGEVIAPLTFGSGTGEFTGTTFMPQAFSQFVTAAPMTVYSGEYVTVSAILNLDASLDTNATASFGVVVPESSSFDFQNADSVPEPPTMGLLAAGFLLFGYRRLTSRS
jgi:hypothetical protein